LNDYSSGEDSQQGNHLAKRNSKKEDSKNTKKHFSNITQKAWKTNLQSLNEETLF